MRRNARVDANQPDIVKGLRKAGASVAVTSNLGKGFPDITVGYRGANYLFEIKDPAKPPSQRKLTDNEDEWHRKWGGHVAIIETAEEALHVIGAL